MNLFSAALVLLALAAAPAFAHEPEAAPAEQLCAEKALFNRCSITEKDGFRLISSNGLPDHGTGSFPNAHNPNAIGEQKYEFRVSLAPKANPEATKLRMSPFGVALNGVPFEGGTAEFWARDRRSGWNYEALSGKIDLGLDANLAHVQPGGKYHYHGLPGGLITLLQAKQKQPDMLLIGWAADGFPVYAAKAYKKAGDAKSPLVAVQPSWQLKKGLRPGAPGPAGAYDGTFSEDYEYVAGSGDLDDCNSRVGVTPEFPKGTYYYVITDSFPRLPRYWRGTPDPSFLRRGPPPGR